MKLLVLKSCKFNSTKSLVQLAPLEHFVNLYIDENSVFEKYGTYPFCMENTRKGFSNGDVYTGLRVAYITSEVSNCPTFASIC